MIEPRSHIPIPKPTKSPKKARKGIRKTSKRRAQEMAEYMKKRAIFLRAHPYCQWWIAETFVHIPTNQSGFSISDGESLLKAVKLFDMFATDIHHMAGREGKLLLDERYWMAVSREGHRWIHDHVKDARQKGYLITLDYKGEPITP